MRHGLEDFDEIKERDLCEGKRCREIIIYKEYRMESRSWKQAEEGFNYQQTQIGRANDELDSLVRAWSQ